MTRAQQQPLAFEGRGDADGAAVRGIGAFDNQALLLKGMHDARHGGRTDLFGVGKLAEGERTGEDDYGERGEARGVEGARTVCLTEAAQEMDGGGVQGFSGLPRGFG